MIFAKDCGVVFNTHTEDFVVDLKENLPVDCDKYPSSLFFSPDDPFEKDPDAYAALKAQSVALHLIISYDFDKRKVHDAFMKIAEYAYFSRVDDGHIYTEEFNSIRNEAAERKSKFWQHM
ncbi:hypothetical protein [Acetobacter estunensis]|uniref:hypothetical protein n=1 Tax=Acetobacter estunensis TaxID=104097 RepID=UPI001C2DF05B|nr:hypothetical protein [Acetobacter estunensis]MBV1835627.1 hypothetical protein [Acetobacter estunensis]MBV1836112.1 hypothetical protein [Acetobacter estunensis]